MLRTPLRAHCTQLFQRNLPALAAALAFIVALLPPTVGQPRRHATRQARSQQAQREHARRQRDALAALREAADAAPLVEDRFAQAQVSAAVAELMWKFDGASARTLLTRAWEAATIADREEDEAREDEARDRNGVQVAAASAPPSAASPQVKSTAARDAVLLVAARCDETLANKFLSERERDIEPQVAATTTQQATPAAQPRRSPWGELSAGAQYRLALARTLFAQGHAPRAAAILAPALRAEPVAADAIEFLIILRRADAASADMLYAQMLAAAQARSVLLDANDVSLLGAYIIAPELLAVVDASGALQLRYVRTPPPAVAPQAIVPAELRRAFGNLAAAVLLRVQPAADRPHETAMLFFVIERLLPFFARETPEAVANLNARRDVLAAMLDATRREQLARTAEQRPPAKARPSDDALRLPGQRLRAMPEGADRDAERLRYVRTAVRRLRWADARRVAAEITDLPSKSAAAQIIRTQQIAHLKTSYAPGAVDDYERAARFIAGSDVPPAWSAWGLAQAAELAHRRGRTEAAHTLFDKAIADAARADAGQRIAAYIVITRTAREVAPRRTGELLAELVHAVNAHEDFTGDARLTLDEAANGENESDAVDDGLLAADFALEELFGSVAAQEFSIAHATARTLTRPLPRALALLGVARATLAPRAVAPVTPRG